MGDLTLTRQAASTPLLSGSLTGNRSDAYSRTFNTPASRRPRQHDHLRTEVQLALYKAYGLALEKVEVQGSCRQLFTSFGADPFEMLQRATYVPAEPRLEADRCRRTVAALTSVGGSKVRLCMNFSRLHVNAAATILIHEALHHAGLTEWPYDPEGLRPHEINRLVEDRCGL